MGAKASSTFKLPADKNVLFLASILAKVIENKYLYKTNNLKNKGRI